MTVTRLSSAHANHGSCNTLVIEEAQRRMLGQIQHAFAGTRVRLDLSVVTYGGAAFAGMLVRLMERARQQHVDVRFTGVQPQVHEVLAICRLTESLPIELAAEVEQQKPEKKETTNDTTQHCGDRRFGRCR